MRAYEFLTESALDEVHDALDVASYSLPHTYVIPDLKNSDFYKQYRFGMAIAATRGEQGHDHEVPKFRKQSKWGGNTVITSFDPNIEKVLDKAMKKVGIKNKVAVSSPPSDEMPDTNNTSILKPFRGF